MSRASFLSAKRLYDAGDYRGCANRAYYAACHAATAWFVARGEAFPNGWNNPSHEQVPRLLQQIGDLQIPIYTRRRLAALLRTLRQAREDADYRPGQTVDVQTGANCLRDTETALRFLGIRNEQHKEG